MKFFKHGFRLLFIALAVLSIYIPYRTYSAPGTWTDGPTGRRYTYRDGSVPRNTWIADRGQVHYVDETGTERTGWIRDGDDEYYVASPGEPLRETLKTLDGRLVAFDEQGHAVRTGFFVQNNASYYIKADGTLAKNEVVDGYYADAEGILTRVAPEGKTRYHLTLDHLRALPEFSDMFAAYDAALTPEGQEIFYDAICRFNDGYLEGETVSTVVLPNDVLRGMPDIQTFVDLYRYHLFMPGLRDTVNYYKPAVAGQSSLSMTMDNTGCVLRLSRTETPPKVLETIRAGRDRVVAAASAEKGDWARITAAVNTLMEGCVYKKGMERHHSYGVYADHAGVCESFATALTDILNEMGYEVFLQTGYLYGDGPAAGGAHGWVRIRINDTWREIDPTTLAGGSASEYILKTKEFFEANGYAYAQAGPLPESP
ncbi:MAG: transglutaminase domain-containing protein [Eubacteriales bacterium]|nr:transglutaminase domain-containing protein [Eubacteriales bacterium]